MAKECRKDSQEELRSWPERVMGGKYVRILEKQLQGLRDESPHGNRELFLDDVFVVYLLAFFTPSIRSLRTIEDFSQTRQARQHLSIRKICKSTLSDFNQLADPRRLEPIIQALRRQLSRRQVLQDAPRKGDLQTLLNQTVAVDGTFVPAVSEVIWAIGHSNDRQTKHYRARLDVRLNVASWLPEAIVVPEVGQSEADSAIAHLQDGQIYLYDRGYMSFDLVDAHYAPGAEGRTIKSYFVMRFKPEGGNSPELRDPLERPLTNEDRAVGVLSDRTGSFTSPNACRAGITTLVLREVVIEYADQGEKKTIRLITNLLNVSASTLGILYRNRWQVELFIRWFKSFGNFAHLLSHQREAVQLHLYVTIIAALLMYLHTGHRPSKYLFALLSQVAAGGTTLEEVIPILRERERQCELARQSAARRREKKQAERD